MEAAADLKAVRRDLKAWQVAFQAEHERAPTRTDIDAAPEIGRRMERRHRRSFRGDRMTRTDRVVDGTDACGGGQRRCTSGTMRQRHRATTREKEGLSVEEKEMHEEEEEQLLRRQS